MENNSRCLKCFRSHKACLCSFIRPIPTKTFFVLLMHPKEYKKERLGTGRLTHLCLPNSQIIMGVDFTDCNKVNQLINDPSYRCFVLYPGPNSHNISTSGPLEPCLQPATNQQQQDLIFIIDATWPCARKMMKLSQNLHKLPQLSFTPTTLSQFRFKKQPNDLCLSTIEVVHTFISQWEKPTLPFLHDHLLDVFAKMVQFQLDYLTNPEALSYRKGSNHKVPCIDANEREKAKKWENRNIFFGIRSRNAKDEEN